jgi:hypothetical protein
MVTDIVGCIKKGTLAELPSHGTYLSDYLYYVTTGANQGDLYWNNGTAWVMLQGATKAEIIENKTIDLSTNTVSGVLLDPFLSRKREGLLVPSPTAAGSLKYAMKGLPIAGGTYSMLYDTTEKYVSRFTESTAIQIGYQSNATTKFITRRGLNPYLKVRCRTTNPANTFMFVGFSTKAPTANGAYPIDATASGIIVGQTNADANFIVRNGNGSNFNNVATTIPRDGIFRTFEIIMSASNIITKIDGTTVNTATTFLPALTTDLYLLMEFHNRTSTNSFDIAKAYFKDDII